LKEEKSFWLYYVFRFYAPNLLQLDLFTTYRVSTGKNMQDTHFHAVFSQEYSN